MDALGKALGMDLEIQEREASVGTFSLDLLAYDVKNNRPVVIENQLEATDHSHLGQLLTYAAGYDSNVIVWIAKEFRNEHRAALDFLNGRTGEETEFFGVVVELWQIDESRPAPHFMVVSAPNDWTERTMSEGSGVSKQGEKYREFFQPLVDTLREEHSFTNARKATTKSFQGFSSSHSKVSFIAVALKTEARVEIYLDKKEKNANKELYDRLEEQKETIEAEMGVLYWQRLDNKSACRISVTNPGLIFDDQNIEEDTREWMIDRLLAFKRVFGPILTELVE